MISLGIPEDEPHREATPSISFRDTPPWFPDIPHESLCLNEQDYQVMDSIIACPLFWIHFGGLQGAYLSNVIAISAWILDGEKCTGVEVEYDREVQGTRVHSLGICGLFSDDQKRALARRVDMRQDKVTFNIDGPNGEFVSAVCVGKIPDISFSTDFIEVGASRFLFLRH